MASTLHGALMKWTTTAYTTTMETLAEAAKHSIFEDEVAHIRTHKNRDWRDYADFDIDIKRSRHWNEREGKYEKAVWFGVKDNHTFTDLGWKYDSGYGEYLGEGFPSAQACKDAIKKGDL